MTPIQERLLAIFKEVSIICNRNGIPYYAIGGTCLGAVRHKGFIPWDDDLDIAIPIEFYDKFADVAKKELPDFLYLQSANDLCHYHYVWYKVCDRTTTFIEQSEYRYKDAYKGVFVDIMPISGVPVNVQDQKAFINKLKRYEWTNNLRRFPLSSSSVTHFLGTLPFWLWTRLFELYSFSNRYLKVLGEYPMLSSELTGYTWSPSSLPKLTFPVQWFAKGIMLEFEDTQINCPLNYHAYLKCQFGDYMKLPPIDQRQVHNGFVDLQKSYTEYRSKGLPII